jgi:hypothetical protein
MREALFLYSFSTFFLEDHIMRNKLVASVIVVALWAVAAPAQNQITNWEFDQGIAPLSDRWFVWQGANFTGPGLTVVENAGLSGRPSPVFGRAGACHHDDCEDKNRINFLDGFEVCLYYPRVRCQYVVVGM